MKFGENLQKLRKEKGISQEQLAEQLGVTRQSVSKWESGNSYPEMDKIVAICNLFHCDMDVLINKDIIEERERKFNVEFLNGFAYIDNQGYILEISEQKLDLPVIQGISTQQEQIVEGNRLNEEDLVKLQTVIQIMSICKSYELDGKVSSIDITNKNDYVLYMESEKKEIYLGDDSNLSNKMLYVPAILEENKDKEGTIYLNGDLNNNFKPRFREKV